MSAGRRRSSIYSRRAVVAGLAAGWASVPCFAGERVSGASFAGRSAVLAPHGAAATASPLATQAAIASLRSGGSAADAAIAAAAVLAVVEPMMSGPGGDLFALVWDPRIGSVQALSSAGAAPAALDRARVLATGAKLMPSQGALSITVPGAVAGWQALLHRFGRRPLSDCLATAIAYARDGVPLSRQIAFDWQSVEWFKAGPGVLGSFDELKRVFLPEGTAPRQGTRFINPDLANSLSEIASDGWSAFIDGRIGRSIERTTSAAGALITRADMQAHKASWGPTIYTDYRGYRVHQVPLPGQGLATLQILNLLSGFDIAGLGFGTAASARLLIEAIRVVYEDRARLYADPDRAAVDASSLLSAAHMAERRNAMRLDSRVGPPPRIATQAIEQGDTTMIVTADTQGQMVALITSVSGPFGSGIVAPGTGFPLQNCASAFALDPAHANALMPGKRPFHTIIPGFVTRDDKPWLAFGVMGGAIQPQGHAQVLTNIIDHGLDVQEAGDAPRLRLVGGSEPNGGESSYLVRLERDWAPDVATSLRAAGYRVAVGVDGPDVRFGGYQAIRRDASTGWWQAASEMRGDGIASGF